MCSPRIFISYSRRDIGAAAYLASELSRRGARVFIDFAGLDAGQQWDERLGSEIEQCDYFVLLKSPNAVASEWVRREIDWARQKGKAIVPVLLEPTAIPFPLSFLNSIQHEDFTDPVKKLAQVLNLPEAPLAPLDQGLFGNLRQVFGSFRLPNPLFKLLALALGMALLALVAAALLALVAVTRGGAPTSAPSAACAPSLTLNDADAPVQIARRGGSRAFWFEASGMFELCGQQGMALVFVTEIAGRARAAAIQPETTAGSWGLSIPVGDLSSYPGGASFDLRVYLTPADAARALPSDEAWAWEHTAELEQQLLAGGRVLFGAALAVGSIPE